jgi:hypothetical protein
MRISTTSVPVGLWSKQFGDGTIIVDSRSDGIVHIKHGRITLSADATFFSDRARRKIAEEGWLKALTIHVADSAGTALKYAAEEMDNCYK